MFVVSARLSRILPYLGLGTLAVAAAVILLAAGGGEKVPVASQVSRSGTEETGSAMGKEDRVSFLRQCGWIVDAEQEQAEAVTIPAEFDAVYTAFNTIQTTQGYDLLPYAGRTVMSYTYPVLNYPEEEGGVYAELLVQGGEVIGGTVYSSVNSDIRHGLFYERTGS